MIFKPLVQVRYQMKGLGVHIPIQILLFFYDALKNTVRNPRWASPTRAFLVSFFI